MRAFQPCALAALAIIVVAPAHLFAQSSVDSRVQKLEDTIHALERRVAALEAQLNDRSATTRAAPANADWRKLHNGMSESDVERLLGSPSKVNANEIFVTWYYGYPGGGRVDFDGKSHEVTGWTEP